MWVDALVQRVREDGRVQNVVLATGVNAEGKGELLGVDVITVEDGAGWTAFLRHPGGPGACRASIWWSPTCRGAKARPRLGFGRSIPIG